METNFVAWNPSTRAQLVSYSPGKVQLLAFSDDDNFDRQIKEVQSWEANQVQCLEWRVSIDAPVFAFGTAAGSVHVINAVSCDENIVSQGARLGRRSCNAVSWNRLMPSQLLAGFDNLKSEFCAAVWDFEHEHYLHTSFGESACSLSWLPDNAHSLAVGTSMGWVKVYDTRTNSQVGATCSVLAHPAPRPRKIRGIRPDPFRPHLFATFSDFAGDVVKVWDLRKVASPASKSAVVPPSFVVVPSSGSTTGASASSFSAQFANNMTGEAEAVVDASWSTARTGVIAVATSARRSVSFFSTSTVSGTSNMPLYSVSVPAPVQVNGLAWQAGPSTYLAADAELAAHHRHGSGPSSPLQADRKSILASMGGTAAGPGQASSGSQTCWEHFKNDEELRGGGYGALLKSGSTNGHSGGHAGHGIGHETLPHPRLLAATVGDGTDSGVLGFAEVEVLDRVPFAISCAGGLLAVNTARGRRVALSSCSVGHVVCQQFATKLEGAPAAAQCYRYTDVAELTRQRCLAGYSADAYTNLEVLAEELDAVYSALALMPANEAQLLAPAVSNTKAVYRTWVWMDRLETTITDTTLGLTIANCGILEVLVRNQLQHSASNMRQGSQWGSARHQALGATVFSSEGRDTAKKLCGWIKMFGLTKTGAAAEPAGMVSRSSSGSVAGKPAPTIRRTESEEPGADDDLLDVIVDELFQDSFERAAAIALWHGRIDLAVSVLRRAIAHMEDTPLHRPSSSPERHDSKPRTRSGDILEDGQQAHLPKVLWDTPYTPGYLQTVSLVAMCLAGYHYAAFAPETRPASPGKGASAASSAANAASRGSSAAATWASMCKHVIAQLELSHREATGYLVAACRFLLANVGQSDSAEDSITSSSPANMYMEIVDDGRLTLEDRAAFVCTYFGYDEAVEWLENAVDVCSAQGQIEAVLITGLSEAGLGVLQRYIDKYDDVQTVALLVSRVIDAQQGQGGADAAGGGGSANNANKSVSGTPSREWVWLHEYRNLLNKWEMFIERAYLDVELGKRYRRKAAMLSVQSDKGLGKDRNSAQAAAGMKRGSSKGLTPQSGGANQGKGKAGRVLYRLPVHSDYPHFYLRCGYCGASLPVDGMQNVRPEQLRVQNNVLNCCAACSKQLPRCYVCQLYMGMVNPYLELNRVMTQKRNSADRQLQSGGNNNSARPGGGFDAEDGSLLSGGKEAEHNTISFGKWFFFCQHCRHGGHANCIDQWFGGTGNVCADAEVGAAASEGTVKRTVCGVNGCDCKCVTRL